METHYARLGKGARVVTRLVGQPSAPKSRLELPPGIEGVPQERSAGQVYL